MTHHVIPKHEWKQRFGSLRGLNAQDNLVNLTIEQHIQAHQLLYEINKNEYDRIAYLALSGQIGKEEANKMAVSLANKGKKYALGCVRSEYTRRLISEAKKGKSLASTYTRTEEHKRRSSAVMLGNANALGSKRSTQFKEHLSKQMKGKPFLVIACPVCGKSGGSNTMRRWHFDNCKMRSM